MAAIAAHAPSSPRCGARSVRGLSALATALLALFFLTVLAAIAGAVALALWLLAHAPDRLGLYGAGLCLVCAAALALWAWPYRRSASLRGAEITSHAQPALFAELRAVARAVGEPLPTQVALTEEANASVAEVPDVRGFARRRVLHLGLPLLRILTVGELRALLAHELGHFHGEHCAGPRMRRAHLAMRVTVLELQALVERAWLLALPLSLLSAPFRLIAWAFLRVSLAISREQERHADQIAIQVAGGAALIGMLRKLHLAELALVRYRQHLAPVLERGLVPPLGEGFSRYLASAEVAHLGGRWLRRCEERGATAEDSHPSMAERIAAAERRLVAAPLLRDSQQLAICLVDDPEQYETAPRWRERGGRRVGWDELEEVRSLWNSPTEEPAAAATSRPAGERRAPQLSEGGGGGTAGSLTRARRSC